MDEMSIKGGLVFNKHTGFVDLGSVNKDIEACLSGDPLHEKKAS